MQRHSLDRLHWERLLELNRPAPDLVNDCIHAQIERHAQDQPDAVAIAATRGEFTYRTLNILAERMSITIAAERQVCAGDVVPLCFDKSPAMIVAMLAVMKAGAAFCPLDPKQPRSRIKSILMETKARLVITSGAHAQAFDADDHDIMVLDDWPTEIGEHESRDGIIVRPEDAAYVIFTSGSTGRPKGVIIEHRSFCSGAAVHAPAQFISKHSRVLQFAAYSHDTSLVEILTTLCVGGTVCAPSEGQRIDGLVDFINSHRVTWAVLTPSFITTIDPGSVPSLQTVVLAGESVTPKCIQGWADSVTLLSGYGVSECSVVTTISKPAHRDTDASNIGINAGGICWVVDPSDVDILMPIGEIGEILIEGPSVGRGYLNNSEASRAAFIDPPQWLLPILPDDQISRRLYRTGDLGRQNADGTLSFVSRKDSQIKISGRRIELGEIEHHILACEGVRLCVVLYPRTGAFGTRLVGLLELDTAQELDRPVVNCSADDLPASVSSQMKLITQKLSIQLPTFMIPTAWFLFKSFPRLPSAKIDRRSIQDWLINEATAPRASETYDLIENTDVTALEIAREVSRLVPESHGTQLSLYDIPLVAAGVDSIKAMKLRQILYTRFGVKLKVEQLLDKTARPTSIAGRIAEQCPDDLKTPQNVAKLLEPLKATLALKASTSSPRQSTSLLKTFLTGASGFLGLEILRQLLQGGQSVVALMRDPCVRSARKRLIDQALEAEWWSPEFDDRLECWRGDLSKSRLGLQDQYWKQLLDGSFHVIIHNGATVHWTSGSADLFPVNVRATAYLLEAALDCSSMRKFVYISGGARQSGTLNEQLQLAHDGYTQTKLGSEMLVQTCAETCCSGHGLDFSIIKPGYIIRRQGVGHANTRDYLWRFLASAVELGHYDQDTVDRWVNVTTDETVARLVTKQLHESGQPLTVISVQDGLHENDMWDMLVQELGYVLMPVSHSEWAARLQESIVKYQESHLLWPLQEILEKQDYGIGSHHATVAVESCTKELRDAFRWNLESLAGMLAHLEK